MLSAPSGPGQEDWMTFTVKLEQADGTLADPPTMESTVTNWRTGDTIPLGRERTLRTRLKNDKSHPLRWLSAFRDRKEGTSLLRRAGSEL